MEQEVANKLAGVIVLSPLLFVIFVPITWIAYRNAPFKTPLRVTFSLAVVPLFTFLMYKNYSFVSDYFPWIIGSFKAVSEARPSGKGTSMLAALITCPLSMFGCFLWYKIHYFVDRKILGGKEPKPLNESEQIGIFNTVWMAIFAISLLLSLMLTAGISQLLGVAQVEVTVVGFSGMYLTLPSIVAAMYFKRRRRLLTEDAVRPGTEQGGRRDAGNQKR